MKKPTKTTPQNSKPVVKVVKSVRDQNNGTHYLLRSSVGEMWISGNDLHTDERFVFSSLQSIGVNIFTTTLRNALKREIESAINFQTVLVAERTGFLSSTKYIFRDGTHLSASKNELAPIVSFQADNRFGEVGELRKWRNGLSENVGDNPICAFLLCYGFMPLLLRLSPYKQNPALELIGGRECGKTTACVMTTSIYGSDPSSEHGVGDSWDMTKNAFPKLRKKANDTLFFVDESNMQGNDLNDNGLIAFMHASTGERSRYTDVGDAALPIRTALLSTGNVSFKDRSKGEKAIREAADTRVITIKLDTPLLSRTKCEALREHVDLQSGTAARKFVRKVIEACAKDETEFKERIKSLMADFKANAPKTKAGSQRILDVFALSYAAGFLAREWYIFPTHCADPMEASLAVYRSVILEAKKQIPETSIEILKRVIKENKGDIRTVEKSYRPKKKSSLSKVFAYRIKKANGGDTFYFPAAKLRDVLGRNQLMILKELRKEGYLIGDKGGQPKLTIKAPACVGTDGRVIQIVIKGSKQSV